jgi:hypothetical protein
MSTQNEILDGEFMLVGNAITVYKVMVWRNPEDHNMKLNRREQLKSYV